MTISDVPAITMSVIIKEILPAIILPNIGGLIGGALIAKDIKEWYPKLQKPSWRPPNWAFGPVWTTLYVMMGISSWLVYRTGNGFGGPASFPLTLYGIQLVLNWIWSPIFFKAHRPGLALVNSSALWIVIAGCIVTFYRVNHTAAYLLVPYLAWATLATALNKYIYEKNPNASRIR